MSLSRLSPYVIREQDPLKQGLKLITIRKNGSRIRIREQDPLKQGLKRSTSVPIEALDTVFVSKIH